MDIKIILLIYLGNRINTKAAKQKILQKKRRLPIKCIITDLQNIGFNISREELIKILNELRDEQSTVRISYIRDDAKTLFISEPDKT